MNQRITAVVAAPPRAPAARPIHAVSARLGIRYCGRTARRSDMARARRPKWPARAARAAVYRHAPTAKFVTPAPPRTREFVLHDTFCGPEVRTPRVNCVTARQLHPAARVNKLK